MSEKTARIEGLIGSLWTHLGRSQQALADRLGEVDYNRLSPALFTAFATGADGMLKLSDAEGETLWYSFAETAQELARAGRVTKEECAAMSAVMDETSEAITQACERELVEAEADQRNPLTALLKGVAQTLSLDYELVRDAVGPGLGDFLAEADQIPLDQM
jgi:hypothetical protein